MTFALIFIKLWSAVVFDLCEIILFATTSYSVHIQHYTTLTVYSPYNNSNADMTFIN